MKACILERIAKRIRDPQTGCIRKNVKVYDVQYRYLDTTGKTRVTKKSGFTRKADAEKFLVEINQSINKGAFVKQDSILLRDYLNNWMEEYVKVNVRETTYHGYLRIVKTHLIPHLGNIKLQDLRAQDIDRLYSFLLTRGRADGKGGLAAKSVQYTHRVFSEALSHAVKRQYIATNPMQGIINVPKPLKYRGEIYSPSDFLRLLDATSGTIYEAAVALAGMCGLRRGECLGLRECDVNFENHSIQVVQQLVTIENTVSISYPKTNDSARVIIAPDEALEIIRRRIQHNRKCRAICNDSYIDRGGLILCYDNGDWINPRNFTKAFSAMLKSKGLKKVRFHDLRHTCASFLLSSNVPLKTASMILGHSSIAITADLYSHVVDSNKRQAASAMSQLLFHGNQEQ